MRDVEATHGAQSRRRMRQLGSDEDVDRVKPIAVDQCSDPLLVKCIKPASAQREALIREVMYRRRIVEPRRQPRLDRVLVR